MDYSKIIGKDDGQRLSFEELVCQLARRDRPESAKEFRRIEGSGGDGGIESYWLLQDGSEVGYQAKYYLKSRDVDWSKIDESVKQALKFHPHLKKYVIAIPCDLTDRSGAQGAGKKGWEHWDKHKLVWEALCTQSGIPTVEFVAWTASDLTEKLILPTAEGLRKFWFGELEMSGQWFHKNVELAVKSLDERYHPEDHVEVGIEGLFKVLLRGEEVITELTSAFSDIAKAANLYSVMKDDSDARLTAGIQRVEHEASRVLAFGSRFCSPSWEVWPYVDCIAVLSTASHSVHELKNWAWQNMPKSEFRRDYSSSDMNDLSRKLDQLSNALYVLSSKLDGKFYSAERNRFALLSGKAGTGKSHTLATVAQKAISDGSPVVLILGQQLGSQGFWAQARETLGLGAVEPEVFLQAMNSAAEAAKKRGLILIDAINEGAGAQLWRSELPALIARVNAYENLVLVVSCRTEYTAYVVPPKVMETTVAFTIRGFETSVEQSRAAKIYLHKRGISQPDTPWLSAEFVNPLFLRSACVALARDGFKQFPRGLNGTKQVFAFYIRSVARNLGVERDGSDDLVAPTTAAILAIASLMAAERRDYVLLADAVRISAEAFLSFPSPQSKTWFDILQKNGIFRLDPPPRQAVIDPFAPVVDVVRFSFQRLQDHLMAHVLLDGVRDPRLELENGVLSFILDSDRFKWEWAGLAEALSVQVPERFGSELLDKLPRDINIWINDDSIRGAFLESLRWRSSSAFTDRTWQFYQAILAVDDSQLYVLMELCANVDHPWNAEFLHDILINKTMPERDADWTVKINDFDMEDGSTIRRLLDWCLASQTEKTDRHVQLLCGLAVTWLTASSHRKIRDKATKALSALLLSKTELYGELCERFAGLDDLYVMERLHGAGYGACCIDPSPMRLENYALVVYRMVFSEQCAPLSIMLRDYASGIVELAAHHHCLPAEVDLSACRPPYKSQPVLFTVSQDVLDDVATKAGGDGIKRSCTGGISEFADEIKHRASLFSSVSLTSQMPHTQSEMHERFDTEVIAPYPDRQEIADAISALQFNPFRLLLRPVEALEELEAVEELEALEAPDHSEELRQLERKLFDLLDVDEKRRFADEFRWCIARSEKYPRTLESVDMEAAKRWVAKRAFDFGWTKERFPSDSSHRHSYSRDRPLFERIGAKYEWLALDELLCRLADSNWLSEARVDGTRDYRSSTDLGFHRDIDPTVLQGLSDTGSDSVDISPIVLEKISEDGLQKWPFKLDPSLGMPSLVGRTDKAGEKWLVLYEHRSVANRYDDGESREHGLRQQEWRFLMPVVVRKKDQKQLIRFLSSQRSLDVQRWSGRICTDEGYLLEAPWRFTWDQLMWTPASFHNQGELEVAFPCVKYHWESHLDASLPEGASAHLPAPWLANQLFITPMLSDPCVYVDAVGKPQFISRMGPDDGSHAYIRQDIFERLLREKGLACVWTFVTERGVWPGGGNSHAAWRRSEGVVWFERGRPKMESWKEDRCNGTKDE